jgi:hypothetical protein
MLGSAHGIKGSCNLTRLPWGKLKEVEHKCNISSSTQLYCHLPSSDSRLGVT